MFPDVSESAPRKNGGARNGKIDVGIILCYVRINELVARINFISLPRTHLRNIHGGKFELEKHRWNRVIFYWVIFDGRETRARRGSLIDISGTFENRKYRRWNLQRCISISIKKVSWADLSSGYKVGQIRNSPLIK